jgi:hypothetical protein
MESSETVETVGFGDVAAVALNLRTGDAAAVEALEPAYHAAALARHVVGLAEQYQDLCSLDFGGYAATSDSAADVFCPPNPLPKHQVGVCPVWGEKGGGKKSQSGEEKVGRRRVAHHAILVPVCPAAAPHAAA